MEPKLRLANTCDDSEKEYELMDHLTCEIFASTKYYEKQHFNSWKATLHISIHVKQWMVAFYQIVFSENNERRRK